MQLVKLHHRSNKVVSYCSLIFICLMAEHYQSTKRRFYSKPRRQPHQGIYGASDQPPIHILMIGEIILRRLVRTIKKRPLKTHQNYSEYPHIPRLPGFSMITAQDAVFGQRQKEYVPDRHSLEDDEIKACMHHVRLFVPGHSIQATHALGMQLKWARVKDLNMHMGPLVPFPAAAAAARYVNRMGSF